MGRVIDGAHGTPELFIPDPGLWRGLICLISVSGDTGQGRETLMECETWRGGIIIWKWVDTHLRQELSGSDL